MEGVARTSLCALLNKEVSAQKNCRKQCSAVSHVYLIRSLSMHYVLGNCTEFFGDQLVVLGAGLDLSYSVYCKNTYYVDFDEVITDKSVSDVMQTSACVKLIAADITKTKDLHCKLESNGCVFSKPTIILIECVLCYLAKEDVSSVLTWCRNTFINSLIVVYDPILPHTEDNSQQLYPIPEFSRTLEEGFLKRGFPLNGCASNVVEALTRLRECGYAHVQSRLMEEMYRIIPESRPNTVFAKYSDMMKALYSLSGFDEFASDSLIHKLYYVALGSNCYDSFNKCSNKLFYDPLSSSNSAIRYFQNISAFERRLLSFERLLGDSRLLIEPISASNTHLLRSVCALYEQIFSDAMIKYGSVKRFAQSALKALLSVDEYIKLGNFRDKYWVLRQGDVVMGFVGCSSRHSSKIKHSSDAEVENTNSKSVILEVLHLCVSQAIRGKGWGSLLLNEVMNYAHRSGSSQIDLSTLFDFVAAREMYRKRGFIELNIEELPDGCRLVHLSKSL